MNSIVSPWRCVKKLLPLMVLAFPPLLAIGEEPPTDVASIRVAKLNLPTGQPTHPIDPALEMVHSSLQTMRQRVDDYSAIFVKRCRVEGETAASPVCQIEDPQSQSWPLAE